MFKCPRCKSYLLSEKCSRCKSKAVSPHYKFKFKFSKTKLE